MIHAFKNVVTPYAENVMNPLISLQPFKLLYEGFIIDSKTGSGTTENNLSLYSYAIRFTTTGTTTMARAELTVEKNGEGQDLGLEVRDSTFNPDGSADGELIKRIVIPKEFLPETAATVYIPLNLTDLDSDTNYWLVAQRAGDIVDYNVLIGEASVDASHPVYYRESGAWTSGNAIRFVMYDGLSGEVIHSIIGTNAAYTYIFDGEDLDKVLLYIPPPDGDEGGIRQIQTIAITGDYLDEGAV